MQFYGNNVTWEGNCWLVNVAWGVRNLTNNVTSKRLRGADVTVWDSDPGSREFGPSRESAR